MFRWPSNIIHKILRDGLAFRTGKLHSCGLLGQEACIYTDVPYHIKLAMASSPAPSTSAAEKRGSNAFLSSANSHDDQFVFLEQGKVDDAKQAAVSSRVFRTDLAKKLLSEFIGTFVLIFASVATSISSKEPSSTFGIHGVAGGAALTVMIIIFSIGHISGAHINPAVTLAFASLRRFPFIQVPLYAGAQFMGSVAASFLLKELYHAPGIRSGVTVPATSNWHALLFELMISFIMMFVVTSVATDPRAASNLTAIAVGATIYLNNLLASEISGASMNPVRTLGPALAASDYRGIWVYFLGPILGTQLGALTYSLIRTTH